MADRSLHPRRRWFQFGLRSLFVFIVIVAISAAWVGNERRQSQHEHRIAERIRSIGGEVEFAGLFDKAPERDPVSGLLVLPQAQSWWRKGLSDLCGLIRIL